MSLTQGIILYGFIFPIIVFIIGVLLNDIYNSSTKKFVTNTRKKYRIMREKQEEIEFKRMLREEI